MVLQTMDIEIHCKDRDTVYTTVQDQQISYETLQKISPYAEGLKYKTKIAMINSSQFSLNLMRYH